MFASKLIFLGLVVAAVLAEEKPTVEMLTEKLFVRKNGFDSEFKTSGDASRKEEANLLTIDHRGIGIRGSYTFTAPDGLEYEVTFTADVKDYKPTVRVLNGQQ